MSTKRILLIDDEEGFSSMLKLNLEERTDYEVKVLNDPLKAMPTIVDFMPNLIFLDVIMPHKEGPDVLFEIENNSATRNIPVIFLTATVTQDEVESQQGVIGGRVFLSKPTELDYLVTTIERHIAVSY